MLATSFCRKEVRISVYIVLGFSLFSVLHLSLLKFENLQTVKALETAEGADHGGGLAEGGRGNARTVIPEAKEFSSTSRGRRKKVQAKGRVKDKVDEGRRRKWDEIDRCKNMYGNLSGHFFKDEVVTLNWVSEGCCGSCQAVVWGMV